MGFIAGGLVFIIAAAIIYNKFVASPDIPLSQLEVKDLKGNIVDLTSYEGKPLVVNYWATWCAPCLKEFPHFEEVKQQYANEVNFIMISDESLEKITSFSNSKPYNFNFLKSVKKLSEYGINEITALPTTYFYDAHGSLMVKHASALDIETLTALIERIN
jgi:thiol-disulfide isomerase/thioredoxin